MRRSELEHLIRAAGAIAGDGELIIIGSQSILGQFPTIFALGTDLSPSPDRPGVCADPAGGELRPTRLPDHFLEHAHADEFEYQPRT